MPALCLDLEVCLDLDRLGVGLLLCLDEVGLEEEPEEGLEVEVGLDRLVACFDEFGLEGGLEEGPDGSVKVVPLDDGGFEL